MINKIIIIVFLLFYLTGCYSHPNYKMIGNAIKIKDNGETATFVYCGVGVLNISVNKLGVVVYSDTGINVDACVHKGFQVSAGMKYGNNIVFFDENSPNGVIEIKQSLTNLKITVKELK